MKKACIVTIIGTTQALIVFGEVFLFAFHWFYLSFDL